MMALACGCMTPIQAAEITTDGSTEVTITKTIPSTYTVTIPKQFDLGTDEMFYVEAVGNVAPTEVLKISAPAEIAMKKQGDANYKGTASFNFGSSTFPTGTLATGGRSGSRFTFNETKAGVYTGTVVFNIKLEKVAA